MKKTRTWFGSSFILGSWGDGPQDRFRQHQVKGAAPAVFTIDLQLYPQLFHQAVHHGQPQPAPAGITILARLALLERLEDRFLFLRRDADARIHDPDRQEASLGFIAPAGGELDPAQGRVANRVDEQIGKNARETVAVGADFPALAG